MPEEHTDAFEVIGEKTTYRLAQRPGSYVVLEYVRPVFKRRADVSVVAGVLTDKFCYHLPLYRQHQRLTASGVTVAWATLSGWVHRAAALLEPIY